MKPSLLSKLRDPRRSPGLPVDTVGLLVVEYICNRTRTGPSPVQPAGQTDRQCCLDAVCAHSHRTPPPPPLPPPQPVHPSSDRFRFILLSLVPYPATQHHLCHCPPVSKCKQARTQNSYTQKRFPRRMASLRPMSAPAAKPRCCSCFSTPH